MSDDNKPSRFRRKQIGKGLRSRSFGRNRRKANEDEEEKTSEEEAPVEEAENEEEEPQEEQPKEKKRGIGKRGRRGRLGRNKPEDADDEAVPAPAVSAEAPSKPEEPTIPFNERVALLWLNFKIFFQDWTDFLAGEYSKFNPEARVQRFRDTSRPYVQTFFAAFTFSFLLVVCTGLGFIASYYFKPLFYTLVDLVLSS